jgi:hypothetical protein
MGSVLHLVAEVWIAERETATRIVRMRNVEQLRVRGKEAALLRLNWSRSDWRGWDTTRKQNAEASTAWVLLACEEMS